MLSQSALHRPPSLFSGRITPSPNPCQWHLASNRWPVVRTAVTNKAGSALKSAVVKTGPPAEKEAGKEGIEVRVVLAVKNKIKQRLLDRIQGGWDYFINGIGKGITVQLVSEEVDPGEWLDANN